jgi:tRNA threonylcarbamoyladenosine biosynthesis protein TsaE
LLKGLEQENVRQIGTVIGKNLIAGLTIALYGQLGVGKTYMIQAICEGLDVPDPVTSPTFTIVNTYQGRCPVYHVDLYRLKDKGELNEIGIEEMVMGDGVCLLEWPEKASDYLESPRMDVEIEWVSFTERNISFTFIGDRVWEEIYKAIEDIKEV